MAASAEATASAGSPYRRRISAFIASTRAKSGWCRRPSSPLTSWPYEITAPSISSTAVAPATAVCLRHGPPSTDIGQEGCGVEHTGVAQLGVGQLRLVERGQRLFVPSRRVQRAGQLVLRRGHQMLGLVVVRAALGPLPGQLDHALLIGPGLVGPAFLDQHLGCLQRLTELVLRRREEPPAVHHLYVPPLRSFQPSQA